MSEWNSIDGGILPKHDTVVDTKIDDGEGVRNCQALRYKNTSGPQWWTADGEMYVYYCPTHWCQRRGT